MQNPIPKFTQSSITTEKPGILSEKLWRAPTTIQLNIFVEILHMFPSDQFLQKGVWEVF